MSNAASEGKAQQDKDHAAPQANMHIASLHLGLRVVKDKPLSLSIFLTIFTCCLSQNVLSV